MKNSHGFTLLETVIALGIFFIIALSAISGLVYVSEVSSRLAVRGELFENARIAMDFMSAHIRSADKIEFSCTTQGQMKSLKVIYYTASNKQESHVFTYNGQLTPQNTKYHRLEFGGNELASYISDIKVAAEGDLLSLQITTDDRLGSSDTTTTPPIVLKTKIKLRHKL